MKEEKEVPDWLKKDAKVSPKETPAATSEQKVPDWLKGSFDPNATSSGEAKSPKEEKGQVRDDTSSSTKNEENAEPKENKKVTETSEQKKSPTDKEQKSTNTTS